MTTVAPITSSHRALLDALKRRGRATAVELAEDLALNVETVREHLQALVRRDIVRRDGTARHGPGRPTIVFALTATAEALFPRREGELLRALGAFLVARGQTGLLREFYDGYLAEQRRLAMGRVEHLDGRARLEEVVRIFDELGFMPVLEETAEAPRLRLCHCPVRELVEATHIPCRAEAGLLHDLLGETPRRVAFIPDGGDACTYQLATRD